MKPAPFRYERPTTVAEAVAVLATGDDDREVKVLAGGQSLVPLLALRLTRPATLVDLNRIDELRGIEERGDQVHIGAMTRHEALCTDEVVRRRVPLLAVAASHIGHRAIRTRGTIGGSLAHADPAAELPTACLALGAAVDVVGPGGSRTIPISMLFDGPLGTTLAPDELVVSVRVPVDTGRRPFGFAELARRPGDFALVLSAVTIATDADGGCRAATVAVGGVGGHARLVGPAARALIGTRLANAAIDAAVAEVDRAIAPFDDLHASAEYRRAMAALMVRRAIEAARGAR
ncbi:MAG: xanthine dehydrogenase family protein subunit M [Acidimicrobiales bacterium]